MNYKDFLKIDRGCPFCNFDFKKLIKEESDAILTYALAPYTNYHLLITPKRHVESFEDLEKKERESIDRLLNNGIKLLKVLGHENFSILLRNGEIIGKSVKHLHYHIIPSIEVGSLNNNSIERNIMTEEEIDKLLEDFKKAELELK